MFPLQQDQMESFAFFFLVSAAIGFEIPVSVQGQGFSECRLIIQM